jgi:ribonucleotide reductase alpha subunit
MDCQHPDIEKFIDCKKDKTQITGANLSVKLHDDFITKALNREKYTKQWPINHNNPKFTQEINAEDLWNKIIQAAHESAEPGALFWDTILRESIGNCYKELGFGEISTNPCQPKWATILTPNGITTIEKINIGDRIWSADGWTTVINKQFTGIKEVYRFNIYHSEYFRWKQPKTGTQQFYGTLNHKIVSEDMKIEICKAKTIDIFKQNTDTETITVPLCDPEFISKEEVYSITVDNKSHTYWSNGCNVSNCGEQPLPILDTCRLLLLNLYSFVENPFTKNAKFNYDKYFNYAKIAQRLMDDIIDLEIERIDKIIDKITNDDQDKNIKKRELDLWITVKNMCINGRRSGTGTTGLADAMAALGIKYGTKQCEEEVNKIYRTHKMGCFTSSVEMAKELGAFPIWNKELEKNNPFLLRIKEENPQLYSDMQKYGRRNIGLLTQSPAGTISCVTQTSSGCEPLFYLSQKRRKKGNLNDPNFRCDFTDQNGDHFMEFEYIHPKVKIWQNITKENDITKSPWYNCCAEDINYKNRIAIQGIMQKHIDAAISSTINLPEDTTVETIGEIYKLAWESGLKGITVYRKNCRSGVILDNSNKNKSSDQNKRPKELPCDVYHSIVNGQQYFVLVGKLNNQPYEIFAGKNGMIDNKIKSGTIIRKKKGFYKAVFSDDETELSPITSFCTDVEEAISRLVSISLRANVDLNLVTTQLEKTGGANPQMHSYTKAIARVLKKYIKDGTKIEGETCPECGGQLVRKEGCWTCDKNCGYSKCA